MSTSLITSIYMYHFAAQALERMMSPTGPSPNPNVPSEYCSTIPPLQQARAAGTLNSPPPTVMVPVSVLKHPNNDSMYTHIQSALCCWLDFPPERYPWKDLCFLLSVRLSS